VGINAHCYIEQEAFKNIVIHTAEYAHFDMKVRNWKECYGFLVGYIDEDTKWTHISDAIPMTHGTHFGVEFKKEHYILSAYLNLMIAEHDEFFVGWYHSHPGLGLFLSQTDIINQLGYQIVNEKAIALVFDHTKIILKEPPVQVFQLDNPAYGASSAYHAIEYYIGGIKKKDEFNMIRDFYYKVEADVIASKLGPIEKEVRNRVLQWRKTTKVELPESQLFKKRKKRRGGKKTFIPVTGEQ
jgi:proteasome lid subunit RPN8/RPN11